MGHTSPTAFVLSSVEALVNNWWRKLLRCPVLCTAVTFLGMMLCLYQVSFLLNIIPWEFFSCCFSRPSKENPNYPFVLGLSFYLCNQIWSVVFLIQIQNQRSWTAGQGLIGVEECRLRCKTLALGQHDRFYSVKRKCEAETVSFLFNTIPWEAFSCCLSRPSKENPNYPFVLGLSFFFAVKFEVLSLKPILHI